MVCFENSGRWGRDAPGRHVPSNTTHGGWPPNHSLGEWGEVFGDPGVATAILDHLLHQRHVITIRGERYRRRKKPRAGLLAGATNPPPQPIT